ncbi:MAG: hypothetical protein ABI870_04225 [Rhodanobacter sp.]
MALFGRLKGCWRTSIVYFPLQGPERRAEGEWEFDYALEGRAVIDVWQVPPRAQINGIERSKGQECGLCVRIYDPQLKLWRFTFHGPVSGITIDMLAYSIGSDIVQERYHAGRAERWIFSDISDASFSWRAISSTDGGANWRVDQTVEARRLA